MFVVVVVVIYKDIMDDEEADQAPEAPDPLIDDDGVINIYYLISHSHFK